jgi:hypothetical protein
MNATTTKALLALVPSCMLLVGSAFILIRKKALPSLLQLIGAACLVVVVLTHVSEGLHLFPWMNWGHERSIGHYIDLAGLVLGLTLFPTGYLIYALTKAS